MEIRWLKRNVNLEALEKSIKEYFLTKGFRFSSSNLNSANTVYARKRINDEFLSIIVEITGQPEDFTVKISCLNVPESTYVLSHFFSMIGLGGLILKRLMVLDAYREYECEFEAFINNAVNLLSQSKSSND